MLVQTSFHIHVNIFNKLLRAEKRTGLPLLNIISEIMYQFAKDYRNNQIIQGTVKYQKRDTKDNWKRFRVALEPDDYELFTDMRKVMKRSVSYLIALAVKKYLNRIINKILKKAYKFSQFIHQSIGKNLRHIKEWVLIWKFVRKSEINK